MYSTSRNKLQSMSLPLTSWKLGASRLFSNLNPISIAGVYVYVRFVLIARMYNVFTSFVCIGIALCNTLVPVTDIVCLPYCILIYGWVFDVTALKPAATVEGGNNELMSHSPHYVLNYSITGPCLRGTKLIFKYPVINKNVTCKLDNSHTNYILKHNIKT